MAIMVLIAGLLSLIIIGAGLFQYASAFVNIVSPEKGAAVPAGSSLTILGTSDDNAQFNCNIRIIVDGHRPYQDTLPVAPGDYSRWTFVIGPQYAVIEEGINTITSKAICDAPYEPFLVLDPLTKQYVKHYSINVTGVPSGLGAGSEEPFIFTAPGEDSGEQAENEESTSDESLFE